MIENNNKEENDNMDNLKDNDLPTNTEQSSDPYKSDLPLHSIIKSNKEDIDDLLTLMVTQGQADVNLTSPEGMTPLHVALRHRESPDVECIVAKLVALGADVNVRDEGLRRPYDYAMSLNLWHLASILTDEDADAEAGYKGFVKDRMDFYGNKLVEAVMKSREDEIKTCLEKKPNVNFINKHGAGAIHYVITHCKVPKMKILRMLLDHEADVNLKDFEKDTALNLTVKLVDQLGKSQAIQLIKVLLEAGANTDVVDLDGKDARHIAIEKRQHEVAELLGVPPLQPKKTPSLAPSSVKAPEPSPVTSPSPQPITAKEIEMQTEAPPESSEEETKQTEFYQAAKDGNQTLIAELAAEKDVNINLADKEGIYGIHYCLKISDAEERREILNLLLEKDANVDVQETPTWRTPLHIAVEQGDLESVHLILLYSANIRLKNKEQEKPYDTAIRLGYQEIADVLEEYRKQQLHEKLKRGAKKTKTCVVS